MARVNHRRGGALLLLVLLVGVAPAAAAEPTQGTGRLQQDTAAVELRTLAPDVLARYRADDRFDYAAAEPPPETAWDRFVRWLRQLLSNLFGVAGGRGVEWIFYLVSALAVGWAVLRLLGMDPGGLVRRRDRAQPLVMTEAAEDPHTIDFEGRIAAAEAAGDYREAVRLAYLRVLRRLSERALIRWQPDKTNHVYLRELRRSGLDGSFADLTYLYEWVWYGDFPLEAEPYRRVRSQFTRFGEGLSGSAAGRSGTP